MAHFVLIIPEKNVEGNHMMLPLKGTVLEDFLINILFSTISVCQNNPIFTPHEYIFPLFSPFIVHFTFLFLLFFPLSTLFFHISPFFLFSFIILLMAKSSKYLLNTGCSMRLYQTKPYLVSVSAPLHPGSLPM